MQIIISLIIIILIMFALYIMARLEAKKELNSQNESTEEVKKNNSPSNH